MSASPTDRSRFLITAVAFEGGLALFALGIGWLIGFSPVSRLDFAVKHAFANLTAIGIGLAAVIPLLIGMLVLERLPIASLRRLRRVVRRLVVPLFREASLLDLAIVSLMAGVGEEVLFRGLIQDGLQNWLSGEWGIAVAVVVASTLFGLAHSITRAYFILAAITGAYLGLLHLWTDNLLAPITAHAVYDFFALVYFTRRARAHS